MLKLNVKMYFFKIIHPISFLKIRYQLLTERVKKLIKQLFIKNQKSKEKIGNFFNLIEKNS